MNPSSTIHGTKRIRVSSPAPDLPDRPADEPPPVSELYADEQLPSNPNDEEDAQDSMDEVKEQMALEKDLMKRIESPEIRIILTRLSDMQNKQWTNVWKRLHRMEQELVDLRDFKAQVQQLVTSGSGPFHGLWSNGARTIKPLSQLSGMTDKLYSMVMFAVKENRGVLKDNPKSNNY